MSALCRKDSSDLCGFKNSPLHYGEFVLVGYAPCLLSIRMGNKDMNVNSANQEMLSYKNPILPTIIHPQLWHSVKCKGTCFLLKLESMTIISFFTPPFFPQRSLCVLWTLNSDQLCLTETSYTLQIWYSENLVFQHLLVLCLLFPISEPWAIESTAFGFIVWELAFYQCSDCIFITLKRHE